MPPAVCYNPSIANNQEVRIVAVLNTILKVVFIILSVVITVVILMQEGKSAGLGAISGAADTYWGKNKGRSMEGMLVKLTRIAVILFLLLAVVLNMGIW
jgi:preprotein translocase subunit SecG